jgi:tripartite-type tricarboxylate transporter receptor subunit TctC
MNRARIRGAVIILTLGGALTASGVSAQSPAYPSKPLRLITASPPGSPPDVAARIISDRLAPALGQPVVVENRLGGRETIGVAAIARASPDGYTLGVISLPQAVVPSLLAELPYDTKRDLAPVAQLVWTPTVLVVRSDSLLRSLPDLIATAKASSGRLTFASGGNGTPPHLAGALLMMHAGLDLQHVPYTGAAAGVAAVLGGQVDMGFPGVAAVTSQVSSGKLRALASTGRVRSAALPDVPTMAELGLTGFEVINWVGVVAPAATPKEIITRVADELRKVVAQPDVRNRFASLGMEPVLDSSPEAFGALIQSELAKWARVVREAGIRAD